MGARRGSFIGSDEPPGEAVGSGPHLWSSARAQGRALASQLLLDRAQVGRQVLPRLVGEALFQEDHLAHAVRTEVAEVVAQLAPGAGRPARAPEGQAHGSHGALATGALLVLVGEVQLA